MTLNAGLLVPEVVPTTDVLFTSERATVLYVAYVQMRGRYAYCRELRGWFRFNSREWVRTDTDTVRSALRRACGDLYDELRGDSRFGNERDMLLDLNWVFRQVDVMRPAVRASAERLAVAHE